MFCRSIRDTARTRISKRPILSNEPQTEERIEARNTTGGDASHRPAGKIAHLPYCPRHRPLSDGRGNYPSGGQPMIDRFRDIARALVAVLLLGMASAAAQTAQS